MAAQPSQIGRYEILERVGRGGMGVLYRARDPVLDRIVALKLMSADLEADESARARFQREARAAARLQHPNIVTVYELGETDGSPFIAMEFLGGQDLQKRISSQPPLSFAEKLDIVIQLCHGLAFAHEQGVVHRDIKPGNLRVLPDGTVKIMDFGIARLRGLGSTQQTGIIGTADYLAPELATGGQVDGRADIFAAGVILYELLAGRKPFAAESPTAVFFKIVHEIPPPLNTFAPDVPAELVRIAARALEKDPARRYQKASELAADLRAIIAQMQATGRGDQAGEVDDVEAARRYLRQRGFIRDAAAVEATVVASPMPEHRGPARESGPVPPATPMPPPSAVPTPLGRASPAPSPLATPTPAPPPVVTPAPPKVDTMGGVRLHADPGAFVGGSGTGSLEMRAPLAPGQALPVPPIQGHVLSKPMLVGAATVVILVGVAIGVLISRRGREADLTWGRGAPSAAPSPSSAPPAISGAAGGAESATTARPTQGPRVPPGPSVGVTTTLQPAAPSGAAPDATGAAASVTRRATSAPASPASRGREAGSTQPARAQPSASPTTTAPAARGATRDPGAAAPATVRVESTPEGAQILLDGHETGKTTPAEIRLPDEKPHSVELSRPGYQATSAAIDAAVRSKGSLNVTLPREEPAKVVLKGEYNFEVKEGGRTLSPANDSHELTISAGRHTLRLVAPGFFLNADIEVNAAPGRRAEVAAPGLSRISVVSSVETCTVKIDGFNAGYPPIANQPIAAGEHVIELACPDGTSQKVRRHINPHEPLTERFVRQ